MSLKSQKQSMLIMRAKAIREEVRSWNPDLDKLININIAISLVADLAAIIFRVRSSKLIAADWLGLLKQGLYNTETLLKDYLQDPSFSETPWSISTANSFHQVSSLIKDIDLNDETNGGQDNGSSNESH